MIGERIHPPRLLTIEDFRREVILGTTEESRVLEFKRDYGGRHGNAEAKRKHAVEAARDIVAFANAFGGVILIGVEEDTRANGMSVASSVPGIADVEALKHFLTNAIKNHVVPSTLSVDMVAITTATGTVLCVTVPAHRGLASVVLNRDKWTCEHPRRTTLGKTYSTPQEAIRMALDQSRSAYLAVRHAIDVGNLQQPISISPRPSFAVGRWRGPFVIVVKESDEHRLVLRLTPSRGLGSPHIVVPYGLVEDVWLAVDNGIELLLRRRLLVNNQGEAHFEHV